MSHTLLFLLFSLILIFLTGKKMMHWGEDELRTIIAFGVLITIVIAYNIK